MQLEYMHERFDELQKKYGSPRLDSIYGAGCTKNPKICFIFMNPTGRNVAADKNWKGLKAPWLGSKNAWKLFNSVGVVSDRTLDRILLKKPEEWNCEFAESAYAELAGNGVYVTNLGKCTQDDASPVRDSVFREYLPLLEQEVYAINPRKIITFGNQVSSLFLREPIKVSETRRQSRPKTIGDKTFQVFPVYYPVGQGTRNMPLAIQDILYAMEEPK